MASTKWEMFDCRSEVGGDVILTDSKIPLVVNLSEGFLINSSDIVPFRGERLPHHGPQHAGSCNAAITGHSDIQPFADHSAIGAIHFYFIPFITLPDIASSVIFPLSVMWEHGSQFVHSVNSEDLIRMREAVFFIMFAINTVL